LNPKFIEVLATFFKLGRMPYFKGSFGTLGAIPLVFLFNLFGLYTYAALTFGFILFGLYICDTYEIQVQNHDSPEVVIDEVAGFLVSMLWMPMTWQAFVYVFIAFRILDIFKPFPLSYLDKNIRGGFGVMVDDIAAGVIVNLVFQFIYTQTDWLGVQYIIPVAN
jgi:phosphatidylglycerophosphatase A